MKMTRHLWVLPLFAALTVAWLYPVVRQPGTVLPGSGMGDNVTFVWNLWWMRYALIHHQSFFSTDFLLYPFGANLTLHTHTALPVLVGAVAGPSSVVAANNAVVIAHLFLNFACAYLLAFRLTRRVSAGILAALAFGWSPFVSARLDGHFNLIAAWVLPLSSCVALETRRPNDVRWGVTLGATLATTAFVDYYLAIFAAVIAVVILASSWLDVRCTVRTVSPRRQKVAAGIALFASAPVILVAVVRAMRIEMVDLAGIRIGLRTLHNPLLAAWLLGLIAVLCRWTPRFRIARRHGSGVRGTVAITAAATLGIALIPLVAGAIDLWRRGDYATQHYLARSAPGGVDVATLTLGNPFSALWGTWVLERYARLGVEPTEGAAWLPLSLLALGWVALRETRRTQATLWVLIASIFFLWSLGPWLMVAGHRTPLLLPEFFARYVPVIANARIPGRAMVVVYLALSLLASMGFARLLDSSKRARTAAWILAALLVVECIPTIPSVQPVGVSDVYAVLRDQPGPGAVCELPLGLRDGFGDIGSLDPQVLLNQTVHERPIVGGFIARLPPGVAERYRALPVLGTLLDLSGRANQASDTPSGTPDEAATSLARLGVRFLVLNRDLASAALAGFVQDHITLRELARDEHRTIYEVVSDAAAWHGTAGVGAGGAPQSSKQFPHEIRVRVEPPLGQVRRRD